MRIFKTLLISMILISCNSKDQDVNKHFVASGGEDSGGGFLFTEKNLSSTQKTLTLHIKNFINQPKYPHLITRFYYQEQIGLNNKKFSIKSREVFENITNENYWVGDGSHPLFKIKEIPAFFRSNPEIFISNSIFFSKTGCLDQEKNSRIAAVTNFNLSSKICLDLLSFAQLPTISFEPVLFSLMFHEICHLQGHKDEALCTEVQKIAEYVVSQKTNNYWFNTISGSIRALYRDIDRILFEIHSNMSDPPLLIEQPALSKHIISLANKLYIKIMFIDSKLIPQPQYSQKASPTHNRLIRELREDYRKTFLSPHRELLRKSEISTKEAWLFYLDNTENMNQFMQRNLSLIRSLEETIGDLDELTLEQATGVVEDLD